MTPTSRFVSANGIRLHYLDWGGDGPPCLFVHGTGLCGGAWEPVVRRVAHRLRCLTLDLRGHGDSDKPDTPVTWGLLAQDLAAFMEVLDLRGVLAVGHSRGGGVVTLGAALAPQRYAGAVLVEPSVLMRVRPEAEQRRPRTQLAEAARRRRTVFPSRQAMFQAYRQRPTFASWSEEALWAYINHGTAVQEDGSAALKCSGEMEARFYEAPVDVPFWEAVGRLTFPVLLLYSLGSDRFDADAPVVQRFREAVPLRTAAVPGGHFTVMEHPEETARHLLEFAAELEGAGRLATGR